MGISASTGGVRRIGRFRLRGCSPRRYRFGGDSQHDGLHPGAWRPVRPFFRLWAFSGRRAKPGGLIIEQGKAASQP